VTFEDFLRRLMRSEPDDDSESEEDDPDDPELDDDDDGSDPVDRVYLEFVEGSSAKFYALVIVEQDDGTTGVAFNFGRIGYPREWGSKINGASREKAQEVFDATRDEKLGGGYGVRLWPADLDLPEGALGSFSDATGSGPEAGPGIYSSTVLGVLPTADGGSVAGVRIPPGRLATIEEMTGPAGEQPVLWMSNEPIAGIAELWTRLADAFADTGLWPLIIEEEGATAIDDRLFAYKPAEPRSAAAILADCWEQTLPEEDDEFDADALAPLGKRFPGLAPSTPGERPESITHLVAETIGHLGLVAVERPADVPRSISWSGPANYDLHPADQSTVLRSWEDRFDAYLVGLGSDTMVLAVARPPLNRTWATRIAAEHMAFCPDNIWQGVGTVRQYARDLVGANQWGFWWD
jgi:hypothetical protein